MSNEKRKIITMEDLRNSSEHFYVKHLLTSIRELTDAIKDANNKLLIVKSDDARSYYRRSMDVCYVERFKLLWKLRTELLICNLDDEVYKYINDQLEEIDEEIDNESEEIDEEIK